MPWIGDCSICKCSIRIFPAYGKFYVGCGCPSPVTWTTNNTAGLYGVPDASREANGRLVEFQAPQPVKKC